MLWKQWDKASQWERGKLGYIFYFFPPLFPFLGLLQVKWKRRKFSILTAKASPQRACSEDSPCLMWHVGVESWDIRSRKAKGRMDRVNRVLNIVRQMSPRKRERGSHWEAESPETCEESLCSLSLCISGKTTPGKLSLSLCLSPSPPPPTLILFSLLLCGVDINFDLWCSAT